jgi:hypothetical protein
MHPAPVAPRVHLFVCANRRTPDSPLGSGCGDAGEAVYAELKDEVSRRGQILLVWVTKTYCLGICPRQGATVAVHPPGRVITEVFASDAQALYAREAAEARP